MFMDHIHVFFKNIMKVASLRQQFFNSVALGGFAGDGREVVPASGFSFSVQEIWKVIRENKDLNLPAHKVISFYAYSPKLIETSSKTVVLTVPI